MLSLINENSTDSVSLFVPLDCIRHIQSFCDNQTSLSMFLVCRSWYNCVERCLCLADKYYYLPERCMAYRAPPSLWCDGDTLWRMKRDSPVHLDTVHTVRLELTSRCVEALPRTLHTLHLKSSMRMDDHFSTLSQVCVGLKCLNLSCCVKFTLRGVDALRSLEELDASNTQIRDVSHLSGCLSLKRLNLHRCYELTDAGIRGLETIPSLEELRHSSINVSNVSHLSGCRALRKLNLSSCFNLTDNGIQGIEWIPTLEDVDLSHTGVSDVSRFANCVSLRHLSAASCLKIVDSGIRGLERIPHLETLNLKNTSVGDGVSRLASSRSLKVLNVSGCQKITDKAIACFNSSVVVVKKKRT
eukprot:PhF_6_TR18604/c1_g1_i1/m.27183